MKLAFFGYAWNKALQPDAYMSETIAALAGTGADVDVYLGNQLTKEYGIYGLNEAMQPGRIGAFIAQQGYDAAVSFNNSMLIPEVLAAMPGRIVTVIVDEPEHLFDYHRTGPWPVFAADVAIVAMSSRLERRLIEAVPGVRPRLHFMLPATNAAAGPRPEPVLPISWVASYVGYANLDQYMQLVGDAPNVRTLTIRCLQIVERDGDLSSIRGTTAPEAALIAALPWTFDYFQTQMQNILTNRARLAVVERLAKHGLALFGNAGWRKLLTHDGAVLQALQSGPAPASHADLSRVYNASRISINAPQAHTAVGAVQYRMIDVMASGALLITRHDRPSDLGRVFGDDCPVPTYRDLDELERLCVHYLAHEDERRDLVARCNALLASGYSFAERAVDLLSAVGVAPPQAAAPGMTRRMDLNVLADLGWVAAA
jgi:Glycosyl transferases group 1